MNVYEEIFNSTTMYLDGKGIKAVDEKKRRVTKKGSEKLNKDLNLPADFLGFYEDFSDGYRYEWELEDEIWGIFIIPSLKDMMKNKKYWRKELRELRKDVTSESGIIKKELQGEALRICERMDEWIPFMDLGNGDSFCVDTSDGTIVLHRHDWYDGFTSEVPINGIHAGKNLADFLRNWGEFCFWMNRNVWHGDVVAGGEIHWKPEFFNVNYQQI